ncbi:adhesive plaque matrix protein-like isoform X2 [Portunus trituberculatus]|nr:adhesive plaque matrix protein-like isoform X2 [Portunus trituberculatus]
MYTCTIQPPSEVALGFDKFWAYYFFDKENCENKGMNSIPDWTNYNFTLTPEERSLTTPYDNFIYQCIYLALHGGWILTGIILIYGNARKRWGYYLPWLLVTTTILVMDITISAFCIQDLVAIDADRYVSAMFFILVLYFRVFFIWFINMSQYASACNAFCKSRHKRAKQEHTRQKMAKAHAQEIARAEAATEARVRAQIAEQQAAQEQQRAAQEQQPRRKIPPPVPKKPAAPPELRPFSYLNPAYRPNDPTDVEGMRANPTVAPDIPPKPVKVQQLAGPYFPDDGYSRERHPEGLQRRYDSMRNYRTQDRHPALRRFSSTRGHPSYPQATPYVPAPDYDMTMRPRPSSNQNHLLRPNLSPRSSTSRPYYAEDMPPLPRHRPHHHAAHDHLPPLREDPSVQKTLYYV